MRWHKVLFGRRLLGAAAATLLLLGTTGCKKTATVTGTVTLDGQPLGAGRISFLGDKQAAAADIQADGSYTATGVPVGDVKILIDNSMLKQQIDRLEQTAAQMQTGGVGAGGMPKDLAAKAKDRMAGLKDQIAEQAEQLKGLKKRYRPVPPRYQDADKSGLTMTVSTGEQTRDVELSSSGK